MVLTVLSLLSFVIFRASLNAFFGADDQAWLEGNSFYEIIGYFSSSWGHGNAFRPIVRASFAINAVISGENPLGWRITNLSIHIVNSFLVFLITKSIIRAYVLDSKNTSSTLGLIGIPLIAALLFLTAPNVNVNVTWISARTHSLAATFFLLGFYLYLNKKNKLIVLCSFITAVACYESMAVFPFFMASLIMIRIGERSSYSSILGMQQEYKDILIMLLALSCVLLYRTYVLSIYTVDVGTSANSLESVYKNLAELVRMIFKANPWMLFSFVILTICSFFFKKHRMIILLVFGSGLILLSPFTLAGGVGTRFTYLITAHCSISVCVLFYAFFKDSKTIMALVITILVLSLIRGVNKNVEYSSDAQKAGVIATTILDQLRDTLVELPQNKEIFFAGIPIKYKRSWVHASYFDVTLKKHMRQKDNNAVIFWDYRIMGAPSDIGNATANDDFYLYTNDGLIKVEMDAWRKSPQVKEMDL